MFRSVVVLLMLFIAGPARAQTQAAKADHSLKLPTLVFAGAAAADWATTSYNLTNGNREHMPWLAFAQNEPVSTVAVGAAIDVAGVWLWNRYVGRHHPKLAAGGLYVAAVLRVAIASNNFTNRPPRSCNARVPSVCS